MLRGCGWHGRRSWLRVAWCGRIRCRWGLLVLAVPCDAVDDAVAACGVGDKRVGGKRPVHVSAYLTMALCLFVDEDYAEVATKVTGR